MKSVVRLLVLVALVLLAREGCGRMGSAVGQEAPAFTGGTWVVNGAPPPMVDGRPRGWTLYAFYSPT